MFIIHYLIINISPVLSINYLYIQIFHRKVFIIIFLKYLNLKLFIFLHLKVFKVFNYIKCPITLIINLHLIISSSINLLFYFYPLFKFGMNSLQIDLIKPNIEEYTKIFNYIDKDHSGYIDIDELMEALKMINIDID